MVDLYPFLFEPHLAERPWGGDGLHTLLDKTLPAGEKIGESWEIYSDNVIANGELAGRTLRDVLKEYGERIGATEGNGDDFPLLIKFLDAREWLSVQVHPDDEQAARLEHQPRGKTECWYILHAEPGAQIAYGTAYPMDADAYRAAVAAGQTRQTMAFKNVATGDFIYVPATMPHAIGPGIILYELQQSSDTTYRVYDWDRMGKDGKPRELHLDKALAVMNFQPAGDDAVEHPKPGRPDTHGNWITVLVQGPYFDLNHLRIAAPDSEYPTHGVPQLISVITGTISINGVRVSKGQSTLIPAGLSQYTISQSGGAEILRASTPAK